MYKLVKRNKRFYIENDGVQVYTPPDFVAQFMRNREQLHNLVDALNNGTAEIKAIVAFESLVRNKPEKQKVV